MIRTDQDRRRERIGSAIGVTLLHAALGYLLLAGFGVAVPTAPNHVIKLFQVDEPPPPPALPPPEEKPVPAPAKPAAREGATSPASPKARASPVVAPPPRVRIDPRPTLIAATAPGDGLQASEGASEQSGEGSGSGGTGAGSGSGRSGNGSGGGGVAAKARLVSGRIRDSDYPRSASRSGETGTVIVHLSVGPDGRVAGCRIASSSGSSDLDEATCRLTRERFRYSPARDSQGRAVADTVGWKQRWWLERGGR
jgi:protein TonB